MALMVSEEKVRRDLHGLLASIYERPDVGRKAEEFIQDRIEEIILRWKEFP